MDEHGRTAVMYSAMADREECVELLIKRGASLTFQVGLHTEHTWKHMCTAHQKEEGSFRHPTPNKHPNAHIKVTNTTYTQKSRTLDAQP